MDVEIDENDFSDLDKRLTNDNITITYEQNDYSYILYSTN